MASNYTHLGLGNRRQNIALRGEHLRARRFIHEKRQNEAARGREQFEADNNSWFFLETVRREGFDGGSVSVPLALEVSEQERVGGASRVMSRWL